MREPRFYTLMAVACALMAVLFVMLGLYGLISCFGATPPAGDRDPAASYVPARRAAGVDPLAVLRAD